MVVETAAFSDYPPVSSNVASWENHSFHGEFDRNITVIISVSAIAMFDYRRVGITSLQVAQMNINSSKVKNRIENCYAHKKKVDNGIILVAMNKHGSVCQQHTRVSHAVHQPNQ